VRYLFPAIRDLAEARKGRPIAPLDDFRTGRAGLNLIGLEGLSMIAVSGLDMATWDALAKAANLPLAVFLGGSLAPVPAYTAMAYGSSRSTNSASRRRHSLPKGGFRG
jgi:mandelate racemase